MKVGHHQHRIIREKGEGNRMGSNGNLLEPILQHHAPHKAHLAPQIQTRNPQHTPGLFPRIDTSSDRDQLTNLQQRIKELEKENFRLAHHVQQAEHSLRNYREILAAYNININVVIPKPGTSNTPLQIPPRPQELELEKKYQYATKQIEELMIEKLTLNNSLSESSSQCSSQKRQLDEERQRITQLQQQLLMNLTQYENSSTESVKCMDELIKENEILKQQCRQPKSPPRQSTLNSNNFQSLLKELSSLRTNEQVLRSTYNQEMQTLNTFVNQSLQELQSVAMFAQRELNCKRQELVAARVDKELAILSMQQQIDILLSRLLQFESSKPRTPIKLKTSPKKPDTDQRIQQHEQQIKKQEEIISSLQSQLQAQQTLFSNLRGELSTTQETLTNTLRRLEKASSALNGLQEVHGAEVKAIKHLAHVRELLRVAKEREAGLERDRLSIEIKHLREVQSIMTFSLGTAEQSLIELQPHVVTKLVEGRSRRMLQLEQSYKGRLKDVEQRSSETCAVSTHHLEQFHKKALDNQKTAENMTRIAVDEVKQFLV